MSLQIWILASICLLGWLMIYLAELLKTYRIKIFESHRIAAGTFRILGVGLAIIPLFVLVFVLQPRIVGVFGIASLAIGVTLMGVAIYLWARFAIDQKQIPEGISESLGESKTLVTVGLYGKVRHPIYLATFLLIMGWYFAWNAVYGLLWLPIILFAFFIEIFIEENCLSRKFGDEYTRYKQKVPMFLPLPLLVILIVALGLFMLSMISGWILII